MAARDWYYKNRKHYRHLFRGIDPYAKRAELKELLSKLEVNGMVRIIIEFTDCDRASGEITHDIPAFPMAVEHAVQQHDKWADGPYGWRLISPFHELQEYHVR